MDWPEPPPGANPPSPSEEASESAESTASEVPETSQVDSDSDSVDDTFLQVAPGTVDGQAPRTEADELTRRCQMLRSYLRDEPCLPADPQDLNISFTNVTDGLRFPLYSCPFKGCAFTTDCRDMFQHHVAAGYEDRTHADIFATFANDDIPGVTRLDYVREAIALVERSKFPRIGLSITRRVLGRLCQRYNDVNTKAVACFVCAQIRTSVQGLSGVNLNRPLSQAPRANSEISFYTVDELKNMEKRAPGTLWNNCGYELWKQRYASADVAGHTRTTNPMVHGAPRDDCSPADAKRVHRAHISDWAVDLPASGAKTIRLFGCTEDVSCSASCHHGELDSAPWVRRLCGKCRVPICMRCRSGLRTYRHTSTIPMALANDHFYGYVQQYLVEQSVTWLECAAASVCWSTMLVYYLEEPYGHLMTESMEGAQARTKVRGNLFSFGMAWEDMLKCCQEVQEHCQAQSGTRISKKRARTQLSTERYGLPHSEDTLASLVRVCIRGGNKDLAQHLEGVTMRVEVVSRLIEVLRKSGYAGYEDEGINSRVQVAARMKERYEDKYGKVSFVPEAVREVVDARGKQGKSIVQEKVATPPEPQQTLEQWERTERPRYLLAESSARSLSDMHEEYRSVFQQYGTMHVTTGSVFLQQFRSSYIGMAHPYTLPFAVGGYDVVGQKRWRRPEIEAESSQGTARDSCTDGGAGLVKLFDLTRGLPQRIEGQFRRHWGLVPALWNLYVRERVNLGASLKVANTVVKSETAPDNDVDMAEAAAGLYRHIEQGTYTQGGVKRKIAGDVSKVAFADNLSSTQRFLLANMRFRCAQISGTQEIRVKIGRLGTWASVKYGHGIFMTVSPGERHNYLAIRLSRYRQGDPFVAAGTQNAAQQMPFIGQDAPSLAPETSDAYGFELPGYGLRRLMQAQDPLCVVNAFFVQLRVILATCLGCRMCPQSYLILGEPLFISLCGEVNGEIASRAPRDRASRGPMSS